MITLALHGNMILQLREQEGESGAGNVLKALLCDLGRYYVLMLSLALTCTYTQ